MNMMILNSILLLIFILGYVKGQGYQNCGAYIGARIRRYNFDFTSSTQKTEIDTSLDDYEDDNSVYLNMEVILDNDYYSTICPCGMVTMWQFYAWKPGTLILYVLKPPSLSPSNKWEVVGSSTFYINDQSEFNFFEIPLSSDLWIPIQAGYRLGFYSSGKTNGEPMITYERGSSYNNMYYKLGSSERPRGNTFDLNHSNFFNKRYALAAYVATAHQPMFVNAPFTTTVYTHDINPTTPIYIASVHDMDGIDKLDVTKTTGSASFYFNSTTYSLYYQTRVSASATPYTITLEVTDYCTKWGSITANIFIYVLNEPPKFNGLPAHVYVYEQAAAENTLYKFTPSDASGDTVTCSMNPLSTVFDFRYSPATKTYSIVQKDFAATTPHNFSTFTYYELKFSCSDTVKTINSNFQVEVVKNQPPYFSTSDGYLPGHASVDRKANALVYEFKYDDSDSTSVTISCSCSTACPLICVQSATKTKTYEVRTNAILNEPGYDLNVQLSDGRSTTTRTLSVSTSGRPYTFNSDPVFVNLPQTIYVMENTLIGTTLFKVMYTDENPNDNFTVTQVVSGTPNQADTYFQFDSATGLIKVKAAIDYETLTPGSTGGAPDWTLQITLRDGTQPQHTAIVTGTLTFHIVNVNEGITINIQNKVLTATENETSFPDPVITATDIDGDTPYFSMNCGNDSKYFYLDTQNNNIVKFAREYDMDAGLSGTATCNVSVRDAKGLSDSDTITLSITNINDNSPKFAFNKYVFILLPTTPFFTEIANMSATDADIGSYGTAGGITYTFDPSNLAKASMTEEYFQIDAAGILYVRNLTAFTENSYYVFEIAAADSDGLQGTCTVTVVLSGVATTTTTTTERSLTFTDDYQNYFWLLLIGLVVVVTIIVIGLMIWFDPVVHEYMSLKLLRLNEWCIKRPKPKQPRRTVGKLTVTVNNKHLENDPDNALPWELLAKDGDVPEINEVQERIEKRIERKDRDYKNFAGLPIFEKGKGGRPDSGRAASSDSSGGGRPESDSPKYASFKSPPEDVGNDDEDPWCDPTERRVVITPVKPFQESDV